MQRVCVCVRNVKRRPRSYYLVLQGGNQNLCLLQPLNKSPLTPAFFCLFFENSTQTQLGLEIVWRQRGWREDVLGVNTERGASSGFETWFRRARLCPFLLLCKDVPCDPVG